MVRPCRSGSPEPRPATRSRSASRRLGRCAWRAIDATGPPRCGATLTLPGCPPGRRWAPSPRAPGAPVAGPPRANFRPARGFGASMPRAAPRRGRARCARARGLRGRGRRHHRLELIARCARARGLRGATSLPPPSGAMLPVRGRAGFGGYLSTCPAHETPTASQTGAVRQGRRRSP